MPERLLVQPLYLQLRDAIAARIARGEWNRALRFPARKTWLGSLV